MADAAETAKVRRVRLPSITSGGAPQRNEPKFEVAAAIGKAIINVLNQVHRDDMPTGQHISRLLSDNNVSRAQRNAVWEAYEAAVARIDLHED